MPYQEPDMDELNKLAQQHAESLGVTAPTEMGIDPSAPAPSVNPYSSKIRDLAKMSASETASPRQAYASGLQDTDIQDAQERQRVQSLFSGIGRIGANLGAAISHQKAPDTSFFDNLDKTAAQGVPNIMQQRQAADQTRVASAAMEDDDPASPASRLAQSVLAKSLPGVIDPETLAKLSRAKIEKLTPFLKEAMDGESKAAAHKAAQDEKNNPLSETNQKAKAALLGVYAEEAKAIPPDELSHLTADGAKAWAKKFDEEKRFGHQKDMQAPTLSLAGQRLAEQQRHNQVAEGLATTNTGLHGQTVNIAGQKLANDTSSRTIMGTAPDDPNNPRTLSKEQSESGAAAKSARDLINEKVDKALAAYSARARWDPSSEDWNVLRQSLAELAPLLVKANGMGTFTQGHAAVGHEMVTNPGGWTNRINPEILPTLLKGIASSAHEGTKSMLHSFGVHELAQGESAPNYGHQKPKKTVIGTQTNKLTGAKRIKYSDGTTEDIGP